ncbi:hypothetical protein M0R72_16985 [Candidatus Pacearchaeota archaeon]|jgi:hypothetical protein|nr:hypothetical protein [Candidatus Pacearchaeota archaeon]
MTLSDANIMLAIQSFTAFSVQTSAEATAGTNTTANILYSTASRTQAAYTVLKAYAVDQLASDLDKVGKTATDSQSEKALAYLIAAYYEQKDPDIFAKSVSFDGYSVSRDGQSGYMKAYQAILDALPLADSGAIAALQDSDGLIRVRDHTNYPESWRLTEIDSEYSDPF